MQSTSPSQTNHRESGNPRGPVLVNYQCPSCHVTSLAPLRKVANGPVGYWCCEACDQAFRVKVDLEMIPQARAERRRVHDFDDHCSPEESGAVTSRQQRMLELYGESLHLRSRLAEVGDAIVDLGEMPTN